MVRIFEWLEYSFEAKRGIRLQGNGEEMLLALVESPLDMKRTPGRLQLPGGTMGWAKLQRADMGTESGSRVMLWEIRRGGDGGGNGGGKGGMRWGKHR